MIFLNYLAVWFLPTNLLPPETGDKFARLPYNFGSPISEIHTATTLKNGQFRTSFTAKGLVTVIVYVSTRVHLWFFVMM